MTSDRNLKASREDLGDLKDSHPTPETRDFLNAEVSGDTGTFEVSTSTDGDVAVDFSGALQGHSLVYLPPQVRPAPMQGHSLVYLPPQVHHPGALARVFAAAGAPSSWIHDAGVFFDVLVEKGRTCMCLVV